MRAAVLKGETICVETMPDPTPKAGQIVLKPLCTGICGSDLSLRKQMVDLASSFPEDQQQMVPAIVPGHEFSAEIVDIPKGIETDLRAGDRVTGLPFSHTHEGMQTIGLSPDYSGGLASLACLDAVRSFRIPDSVPSDLAALTEPLSVGLHAANLANRNHGPGMVIGCGPVGLAVILALTLSGRGPVMAADFSPVRRKAAEAMGADIVIDPAESSPFERWDDLNATLYPASPLLAREFRGRPSGLNVFECTGVPGVLNQIVTSAPPHSHVVVAGVCPHDETITPLEAIIRELTLEFSFAYRPEEFAACLNLIGEHPVRVRHLISSQRPLDETGAAFDALASNPSEIKILINPQG